MQSSSNRNPCPVCQRSSDADCRWSDDTILCHTGSGLRLGQCITIDGQKWALTRTNAGHSGKADVFHPHQEREPGKKDYFPPHPNQELLSLQTKRLQWADIFDQFFAAFDAAWNIPDFYESTPDQLAAAFEVIDAATRKAAQLRTHLRTIWRDHPDLDQLHRLRVERCIKLLAYMADDLRQFKESNLGLPCPAAVRPLAEGF